MFELSNLVSSWAFAFYISFPLSFIDVEADDDSFFSVFRNFGILCHAALVWRAIMYISIEEYTLCNFGVFSQYYITYHIDVHLSSTHFSEIVSSYNHQEKVIFFYKDLTLSFHLREKSKISQSLIKKISTVNITFVKIYHL